MAPPEPRCVGGGERLVGDGSAALGPPGNPVNRERQTLLWRT